ncbi:MAG: hypothetical protein MK165_14595 [Pirellulaceae bacterium]|nr:hypothetical protein [Pirellulaceae bacterium]
MEKKPRVPIKALLLVLGLTLGCLGGGFANVGAQDVVDLGVRRELFLDDRLIESLDGAQLKLHVPQAREVVLEFKKPWEGIYSAYFTLLQDNGRLRLYYRGLPVAKHTLDAEVTCVAESNDGVHWTKPELGLFEVAGTAANNVVLAQHRACHNFAPFIDRNPLCPPHERYKALGGTGAPGLIALTSSDGIHWHELQQEPVITQGAFDSQNVAFWSESEEKYICYFRVFREGIRWVARCTSEDFLNWSEPVDLDLDSKPRQHLYTNQFFPYPRARHIYVGFPTRFLPGRRAISKSLAEKLKTSQEVWDFSNDCADVMLTTARGGSEMRRTFLDAFVRPGLDPKNWTSRANYAVRGMWQSTPEELSIYLNHNLGYDTTHLRRYTVRTDGFVSINAPFEGGELITKPLIFGGRQLSINYASSAAGGLRVEIQTADGQVIPGYSRDNCLEIIGDHVERTVVWERGSSVASLRGQPVRLRFVLSDADLYSLRFLE